jgi:hypothetical protein
MASRIKHKRSSVAGRIPLAADLEAGELALNTNDGKVYLKKDDNSILDVNSTIFKNDTNVTVTDTGIDGTISVVADNIEKLRINATQVQFKETTTIENAKELQLKELTASGSNYVGLKAPDLMSANYTLTLPTGTGGPGQLLGSDGFGNLQWSDPDTLAETEFMFLIPKVTMLMTVLPRQCKQLSEHCKLHRDMSTLLPEQSTVKQ